MAEGRRDFVGKTLWGLLRGADGLWLTHERLQGTGRGPGTGDIRESADTLRYLGGALAGKRRAWLYRTFKNLFFDWYRRSVLENEYVRSCQLQPLESSGTQEVECELLLQSISPQDRTLFQLRYCDGYTAKEISEMLGLPAGTVRSRLSRCRKQLKELL